MKKVLTIAGSDSIGGAGIQADIKTMTVNGVYAMSAVTSVTVQNTMGVTAVMNVTADILKGQLDAVFNDIRPDSVKIGMLPTIELIETAADRLTFYKAENIVLDPVMVATSGSRLINENAVKAMKEKLFPISTVITPNIYEAEILSGIKICTKDDMIKASSIINGKYKCAVLCKGGHSVNDADDLLYIDGEYVWFNGKRIDNPNTHGTGCTLSSAIAANLAKGYSLEKSIKYAKDYISGALSAMLDLGKGSGPMKHSFDVKSKFC